MILDHKRNPIALINPKENVVKQIFPGLKRCRELTLTEILNLELSIPNIGIELKCKKKVFPASEPFESTNKSKRQSPKMGYELT